MANTCDCIIPFYNEGNKPLYVVDSLLKTRTFSKIIVIDDGSGDITTHLILKNKYPHVISLRSEKNEGKAQSIKKGLNYSKAKYVLLMDGDLTNINKDEINNAVRKITINPLIDLIILRRVADKTAFGPWSDIMTSGQRILRRVDLENVFQTHVSDYQLEIAVNTYMIRSKKHAYWMPLSIHNERKWSKWGIIEGTKRMLKMTYGFIAYAGLSNFIWQTLFFCRQEAP